ncbi:hypothetical protein FVE85_8267 [Porphyridium purpureum]|uniref:Uncharacterized protein n=1 Tax=Porphyridium purpureum TaxID=35688 RepID=A0A5J4YKX9_PORPP|nr:hypothetical protein FVE85_8267 [Porphyridium purpureum]|eukprot:POR8418..scf244_11
MGNAASGAVREIWDREYGIEPLREQANKKLLLNIALFTASVIAFREFGHLFAI